MIHHRLRGLQKGSGAVNVADVFATSLYTGTGPGVGQTITNGINLSGEGGLVWLKNRTENVAHRLHDSARGVTNMLDTTLTNAESSNTQLSSFTSSGFTLDSAGGTGYNNSLYNYVAWTFRQAPRFFDVVTFTSPSSGTLAVSHSLDKLPGFIIVKRTDGNGEWMVYHRSTGSGKFFQLELTTGEQTVSGVWASVTTTNFRVTVGQELIANATYVAYLFAHDPDGVIQCGSYTGNGSTTGPTVTLGWEPQYLLIKNASASANWVIYDSSRDTSNPRTYKLFPNLANTEDTAGEDIDFTSTGFQPKSTDVTINANTNVYIYMAIKKAA